VGIRLKTKISAKEDMVSLDIREAAKDTVSCYKCGEYERHVFSNNEALLLKTSGLNYTGEYCIQEHDYADVNWSRA